MRALVAVFGFAAVLLRADASADCPKRAAHPDAMRLAADADKLRATNVDEAIAKYEEAIAIDADDHRLWWKLALAYEKKENWPKVANACRAAEAAEAKTFGKKTHADYYARHGIALARVAASGAGEWSAAIAPLETAVALDANHADAFGELGRVRLHVDDDTGAMHAFSQAIAKAPHDMRHYVALAGLYLRWMLFDHAERVLASALPFAKADDKNVYALHALLGDVYLTTGRIARAVAEYEAATKSCAASSCGEHEHAWFKLGAAYAAMTPPRKAEAFQLLARFWKNVCKGALAQRYSEACAETLDTARSLGGALQ